MHVSCRCSPEPVKLHRPTYGSRLLSRRHIRPGTASDEQFRPVMLRLAILESR